MKKRVVVAVCSFVTGASTLALGEDLGLLTRERSEKGYLKRDRVLVGSMMSVAPSQLHEIYGPRIDAGMEYDRSNFKSDKVDAKLSTPGATFGAAIGGDILVLGLSGLVKETKAEVTDSANAETSKVVKVQPVAAITFGDFVTLGANYDITRIKTSQDLGMETAEFTLPYERLTASLAYHNPRLEVGMVYSGIARASSTDNSVNPATPGFGLAVTPADSHRRDLYIPAHGAVYARGNLTDSFSLQGMVAHVQYDANEAGAIDLFERYSRLDRTAGQLQAIYWWSPNRHRVATTVSYQGATFAPIGTEDNGLGYRLANLYGITLDGAAKVADRTYAGGFVSYRQGERDEFVSGTHYDNEEQLVRVGANLSTNF